MKTKKSTIRKFTGIALAVMLTIGLMFSTATSAFAATATCDQATFDLTKLYKVLNDGTSAPAENFEFTISKVGVSESSETLATMPDFAQTTYSVNHGGTASTAGTSETSKVSLPDFDTVGVYTYRIQEKDGNTAGVEYKAQAVILKVVVTNCQDEASGHDLDRSYSMYYEGQNADKIQNIDNTFKAGSLKVTKNVEGIFGDTKKAFTVRVTFQMTEDDTVRNSITYTDDGEAKTIAPEAWSGKTATADITVKDGETVTFSNIPYGVVYNVQENDYSNDGYATRHEFSDTNRTIDSAEDTATITNTKGGQIDTGLYHRMLPMAAGLMAVIAMMAIVIIRRSRRTEDQ